MSAPQELQQLLLKHKKASDFFEGLAFTHKREYVEWIITAQKEETRQTRLKTIIDKLMAGKRNINEQ